MFKTQLAVPTAVFQLPLRTAIQRAAMLRADGVQFDLRNELNPEEFGETACKQLRHFAIENRLQVAAATFPTLGSLVELDRLDARVAAIRTALDFARRLGARELTIRLGRIPADSSSREFSRLADVLTDLARHSDRVGTRLAVSTTGNSVAQLRSILAAVEAGTIGLDFDPAGFVFAGESPVESLRCLHDLVAHVQIRDGERSAEGAGVETAIGSGEVEWDLFIATLAETDYTGWTTIRRTGGSAPAEETAQALQSLRRVPV